MLLVVQKANQSSIVLSTEGIIRNTNENPFHIRFTTAHILVGWVLKVVQGLSQGIL